MTQIQTKINELVKRVKKVGTLSNLRFIKGYNSSDFASPVLENLISVSTLETTENKSFPTDGSSNLCGYDVPVRFRVYAKESFSGDGLINLCYELSDAIKSCDSDKFCTDIKISKISYDSDANTVFRDVIAKLSFVILDGEVVSDYNIQKETDIAVTIDSKALDFVIGCECIENKKAYKIEEFLSSEAFDTIITGSEYTIIIKSLCEIPELSDNNKSFSLCRYFKDSRHEYTACRLQKARQSSNSTGYITYEYTITAKDRRIFWGND